MDSPNLVDGFTSLIKPNIIPSTSYPGSAFGKMYFHLPKHEPEPPQYDKSPIYTYAVPCKLPALKVFFCFIYRRLMWLEICLFPQTEVVGCWPFKEYVALLQNETSNKVNTLRSDNGGQYIVRNFKEWLSERIVRHEITVAAVNFMLIGSAVTAEQFNLNLP